MSDNQLCGGDFNIENIMFFYPEKVNEAYLDTAELVKLGIKYDASDSIFISMYPMTGNREPGTGFFVSVSIEQARIMAKALLLFADARDALDSDGWDDRG
jgi:hypothetical protein